MKIYILLWGDMPWESCAANPSHLLSLLQQKLQAHPQKSRTLLLMAVCCFTGVKEKKECGFSQSCGVTEAGRDLWASSSPTYAQSRASHSSFPGLNSCKDGKSTTSLDSQCQLSDTLTKKKKIFLMFKWSFPEFQYVPITSCPFTGYHWEPGSVSTSSHQTFVLMNKIPFSGVASSCCLEKGSSPSALLSVCGKCSPLIALLSESDPAAPSWSISRQSSINSPSTLMPSVKPAVDPHYPPLSFLFLFFAPLGQADLVSL